MEFQIGFIFEWLFASVDRVIMLGLVVWIFYLQWELSDIKLWQKKQSRWSQSIVTPQHAQSHTKQWVKQDLSVGVDSQEIHPVWQDQGQLIDKSQHSDASPIVREHTVQNTVTDSGDDIIDTFIAWCRRDWPMKLWWLLLLMGLWWFVMYAIDNNWISPLVRVIGVAGLWLLCVIFWIWKMKSYPVQSPYLIGVWSSIYIVAIFLGSKIFDLYSLPLALLFVLIQYAWMLYLSYRYHTVWLAIIGLFYSLLAPLLLSNGSGDTMMLFVYIAINALAWGAIAFMNSSDAGRLCVLLCVSFYTVLFWWEVTSSWVLFTIVLGLALCSAGAEIIPLVLSRSRNALSSVSLVTLSTALLVIGMSIYGSLMISEVLVSTLAVVLAILLVALRWQYSMTHKQDGYSIVIGWWSLLIMISLLYYYLVGVSFALGLIIVWGFVLFVVSYVTKNMQLLKWLYGVFIIPFGMAMVMYLLDNATVGIMLTTWYTLVIISVWLLLWGRAVCRQYALHDLALFSFASIVVLLCTLAIQLDGYVYLLSLLLVSVAIVGICLWYRIDSRYSLYHTILPLVILVLVIFWNYDMSVDGYLAGLLLLSVWVLVWLYVGLKTWWKVALNIRELHMQIGFCFCLALLYLVVPYGFEIGKTLARLGISCLVYGIATRYFPLFDDNKMWYLWFFAPVVLASWGTITNPFLASITSICCVCVALFLDRDTKDEYASKFPTMVYLYHWLALWFVGRAVYSPIEYYVSHEMSIAILLIVFVLIALWYYSYGKVHNNAEYRMIGAIVFVWVVGRLGMVELRQMSMVMRIVVLVVIGGIMISSGFLGNKEDDTTEK